MKIMLMRNRHTFGGIYRQFRELARYAEGRVELRGVLPMGDRTETLELPCLTASFGRELLLGDPTRASSIDGLREVCAPTIAAIAAHMRTEEPAVCLAVDTSLRTFCFVEAARRSGLPVITLAQGVAPIEERPIPLASSLAAQACVQGVARVVFPSQFAAASARDHFAAMAPSSVVPNGCPPSFVHLPLAPPAPRRLGGVMRMALEKNPLPFLEAGRALGAKGWETVLLTQADDIDEELGEVDFSGIEVRRPQVDDAWLVAFYQSCRLVAGTSRFETYGNVAIEALALGVPMAVTTGMGVHEVYQEVGLDDWVLPVDDVEALVDLAQDIGPVPAEIRRHIGTEYSWDRTCERLFALAREVASA